MASWLQSLIGMLLIVTQLSNHSKSYLQFLWHSSMDDHGITASTSVDSLSHEQAFRRLHIVIEEVLSREFTHPHDQGQIFAWKKIFKIRTHDYMHYEWPNLFPEAVLAFYTLDGGRRYPAEAKISFSEWLQTNIRRLKADVFLEILKGALLPLFQNVGLTTPRNHFESYLPCHL